MQPERYGRIAIPAQHTFERRLELTAEDAGAGVEVLRGELDPEYLPMPPFDLKFLQSDGYLIPVQRGLVIPDNPSWNYIIKTGRVWREAGDQGYSRAALLEQ